MALEAISTISIIALARISSTTGSVAAASSCRRQTGPGCKVPDPRARLPPECLPAVDFPMCRCFEHTAHHRLLAARLCRASMIKPQTPEATLPSMSKRELTRPYETKPGIARAIPAILRADSGRRCVEYARCKILPPKARLFTSCAQPQLHRFSGARLSPQAPQAAPGALRQRPRPVDLESDGQGLAERDPAAQNHLPLGRAGGSHWNVAVPPRCS